MKEVFPILPGGAAPIAFTAFIVVIVMVVACFLLSLGWGSRFARFEVSETGLRIRGAVYGRSIALDRLDLEAASVVHLAAEPDLRITRKTNGSNMPGYWSGWFRLASGRRALLFLTERTRVLHVPTHDDYSLLLSPRDPEGLLAALRRQAAAR
jgi:hypothetical protein